MDIFSYNSVAKGCLYNICNVGIYYTFKNVARLETLTTGAYTIYTEHGYTLTLLDGVCVQLAQMREKKVSLAEGFVCHVSQCSCVQRYSTNGAVLYDFVRLSTISMVVNQMHQPLCQATPVNYQGTGLHFRHQKRDLLVGVILFCVYLIFYIIWEYCI